MIESRNAERWEVARDRNRMARPWIALGHQGNLGRGPAIVARLRRSKHAIEDPIPRTTARQMGRPGRSPKRLEEPPSPFPWGNGEQGMRVSLFLAATCQPG